MKWGEQLKLVGYIRVQEIIENQITATRHRNQRNPDGIFESSL